MAKRQPQQTQIKVDSEEGVDPEFEVVLDPVAEEAASSKAKVVVTKSPEPTPQPDPIADLVAIEDESIPGTEDPFSEPSAEVAFSAPDDSEEAEFDESLAAELATLPKEKFEPDPIETFTGDLIEQEAELSTESYSIDPTENSKFSDEDCFKWAANSMLKFDTEIDSDGDAILKFPVVIRDNFDNVLGCGSTLNSACHAAGMRTGQERPDHVDHAENP